MYKLRTEEQTRDAVYACKEIVQTAALAAQKLIEHEVMLEKEDPDAAAWVRRRIGTAITMLAIAYQNERAR